MTVCVLVLDDATLAISCIESLAADNEGGTVEVIVVANGTSEGARRVLEGREDIVLVRSGTNLGFSGGNNLAALFARGRYLLLLNDDSVIEPGCVDQLVATAESDLSIGAVGGRILSTDGSLQEAGSVLWRDGWATHVGAGLGPGTREFSYVRDVDYVSANGLLVRRSAWDAVGGLDDRYFPAYYEDVDLCMALRRRGNRVVYEPRARLRHRESQSSSTHYRDFLLIRNRGRLVDKWAADLTAFDVRPPVIDDAAVNDAIHRARGFPSRLVVVIEPEHSHEGPDLWGVTLALAADGWAVTVVTDRPLPESDYRPDRRSLLDQMTDFGVDIRGHAGDRPPGAIVGFLAVVVGARFDGEMPRVLRPDGEEATVIRASPEPGGAGVRSTMEAVHAAAADRPINLSGDGR